MSLITRCPACGTAFRVQTSQLAAHAGTVRCGKCGRMMQVGYSGHGGDAPRYLCGRGTQLYGTPPCQSIGGAYLHLSNREANARKALSTAGQLTGHKGGAADVAPPFRAIRQRDTRLPQPGADRPGSAIRRRPAPD